MTGPLAAIRSAAPPAIAFIVVFLPIALIGGGWLPLGRVDPLLAVPGAGWAAVAALLVSRRNGWKSTFAAGMTGGLLVLLGGLIWGRADLPWIALGLALATIGLALIAVFALVAAARLSPAVGTWLKRLIVALLLGGFAVVWQQMAWQVIPHAYAAAPDKHIEVTMLTSLPLQRSGDNAIAAILRGDGDVAPALVELGGHFSLRQVDQVSATDLAQTDVLLLAHPRALAPQSLVAIDGWVRGGGRAILLADGLSSWPPAHALGDPRNPPVTSLLTPLLSHWGVRLDAPSPTDSGMRQWQTDGYRLHLLSSGQFVRENTGCSLSDDGILGDCAIGDGRALLLADADFLHHELWQGARPQRREAAWSAANMLWLRDSIIGLAGRSGSTALVAPSWIEP